jgi:hypothetical protein
MPGAAIAAGVVRDVVALDSMAERIKRLVGDQPIADENAPGRSAIPYGEDR